MPFNLKGLLQDEEFLVAAGLLTAGSQGQGIGQAAFPAMLQAAQIRKAFAPTVNKTKSVFDKTKGENVLATDKQIAENPDNYLPYKESNKTKSVRPLTDNQKLGLDLNINDNIKNKTDFTVFFDSTTKIEENIAILEKI